MKQQTHLSAWLVARGLTAQQADLWGDFIADSVELLHDGHALLLAPKELASFLAGCHGPSPTEPEITSGLGDRMHRLLNEAALNSDRDRLRMGYEVPTPGDHSHGIRKSKADFRFERKFEAGFTASFVVEAKSLATAADLNSRYMGPEGIGCFIDRDPPYSTDITAGMLGYSRSAAIDWKKQLQSSILTKCTVARAGNLKVSDKSALASDHNRKSHATVTILHMLLDFVGM